MSTNLVSLHRVGSWLSSRSFSPFSAGVSRSFSAALSGGKPALHPRTCLARAGASRATSGDEALVSEALAHDGVDERFQPPQRVPFYVAVIQTPGKLVNVPVQMLRGNLMIDTVDSALEDCPNRFNRVGGCRTPRVLPGALVDRFVPVEQPVEIRENH